MQEMAMDERFRQQELAADARAKQQELSFMQVFEKWKAELTAQTQIKVAEIKAENSPEPKASVQ